MCRLTQLDAIEFIHGEGIVHGDVKPANICLGRGDNSGRLYLIDFGFAWRFTTDSPAIGQRGTVPFCSMRVLKGESASLPSILLGRSMYN